MRNPAPTVVPSAPARLGCLVALGFSLLSCAAAPEVFAGGLFSKFGKKERKVAKPAPKPRPRPSAGVLAPAPRLPKRPPARPEPPAPGGRPRTPLVAGTLAPVPRSRPDQIRIFVLGDSQGLLPFGETLQRELAGRDYEVLFHAVKNGTPYFWNGRWPSPVLTRIYEPAASPEQCGRWAEVSIAPLPVAAYVESYDPDVFVFQAGTNFEEDLASEHTEGISGLIAASLFEATSRGAKILWIGPPDARDDVKPVEFQDRAAATLRAALAAVSQEQGFDGFFDSRPVCPIPNGTGGDGEHPSNETGRLWGAAAAAWVSESIERWRCEDALRPPGGAPATPVTRLLSSRFGDAAGAGLPALDVELELVAKSNPGDIRTLSYTDAFSVYRYRLRKAGALRPSLSRWGVEVDPATDEATIHVLHWAVHNNGSGPRATSVSARGVGQVVPMRIRPLDSDPLSAPLATMPRFDDFDDFLAPVFLAADFLEERSF